MRRNESDHTFRNHTRLLHGRLVGCIGLVGCRRQSTQQAAQCRSCQIVSDLERSGDTGKSHSFWHKEMAPRPLVWRSMPGRQQTLLPQAQEREALDASTVNAAELPPQQRPAALLSLRQLPTKYCLECSGPTRKFTLPCLDQPAVLASAAICSSVNPLAAPGEIAQSKPNDEGARSCPYAQLSCGCDGCGGCCNPHVQFEKDIKVHSVIPSGAELAAVPPAYLLPRLWRRQRRRRQPKPALLRSCKAGNNAG